MTLIYKERECGCLWTLKTITTYGITFSIYKHCKRDFCKPFKTYTFGRTDKYEDILRLDVSNTLKNCKKKHA